MEDRTIEMKKFQLFQLCQNKIYLKKKITSGISVSNVNSAGKTS